MPLEPASDLPARIATLEQQERDLVFRTFTNADAWDLGCLLVGLATERGLPVTIDVRRGTQQLFHAALDGTTPHNDSWVGRKSRVVERFGASTLLVQLREAARGRTFSEAHELPFQEYAAAGGAFPVRVEGVGLVGTVAVSGLTQQQDHDLVVEGIAVLLGRSGS
jgi:uncharacterized protein (UPF0303 family)